MRPALLRLAAPFALAAAAAACASGGGGGSRSLADKSPQAVYDTSVVQVVVNSSYVGPLDLYLVSEGVATRLGDANGPGPQRFIINPNQVDLNDLRVVAVPIGGYGRVSTGLLNVSKGNVIQFNIPPSLRPAGVFIR
jgi:hypothetical protein